MRTNCRANAVGEDKDVWKHLGVALYIHESSENQSMFAGGYSEESTATILSERIEFEVGDTVVANRYGTVEFWRIMQIVSRYGIKNYVAVSTPSFELPPTAGVYGPTYGPVYH